jgi:hypothetical protein
LNNLYDVVAITPTKILIVGIIGNELLSENYYNIVSELVKDYGNLRVFYCDNVGNWWELCHNDGQFSKVKRAF